MSHAEREKARAIAEQRIGHDKQHTKMVERVRGTAYRMAGNIASGMMSDLIDLLDEVTASEMSTEQKDAAARLLAKRTGVIADMSSNMALIIIERVNQRVDAKFYPPAGEGADDGSP